MKKAEKKRSTQVLPLHEREGCSWAERRPGEGTAEGSFGAGWPNGGQIQAAGKSSRSRSRYRIREDIWRRLFHIK